MAVIYSHGFEDTTLGDLTDPGGGWEVTTENPDTGTYCVRGKYNSGGEILSLVKSGNAISFRRRWDTPDSAGTYSFKIDDIEQEALDSGDPDELSYTTRTYSGLSGGSHTFSWSFIGEIGNNSDDGPYLDNIEVSADDVTGAGDVTVTTAFAGTGTVPYTGTGDLVATTDFAGTGTQTNSGTGAIISTSDFAGTSTLTAEGPGTFTATVSTLAATGTISSTGTGTFIATSSLAGTGTRHLLSVIRVWSEPANVVVVWAEIG